jgi:hypothetical protein
MISFKAQSELKGHLKGSNVMEISKTGIKTPSDSLFLQGGVSSTPKTYESIPNRTGNYLLLTGNFETFVEVVEDCNAYFYRTFTGERGYGLASNQRLVGPINSQVNLTGLEVDLSDMSSSPIPTPDSFRDDLEVELDEAYQKIVSLEKQLSSLEMDLNNNPLKSKNDNLNKKNADFSEKIIQLNSRANVAEEELELQIRDIDKYKNQIDQLSTLNADLKKEQVEFSSLKAESSKLKKQLKVLENAHSSKAVDERKCDGPSLNERQESSILGIQMLLLSLKQQVNLPYTIDRISELIKELDA